MAEKVYETVKNTGLVVKEGTNYLGIPIGTVNRKHFFRNLRHYKNQKGWVVRDGEISEWNVYGLLDSENETFFYGDYVKGQVLGEYLENPGENWQEVLIQVASAYKAAIKYAGKAFKVYGNSIFITSDGAILFFPPVIMNEVIAVSTEEKKLMHREMMNHPYLEGTEAFSYFLGAAARKCISGEYPFQGNSIEELRMHLRNLKLLPLYLVIPGIKKDVSLVISRALCQEKMAPPGCDEWVEKLTLWKTEGITEELSDQQRENLENQAEFFSKKNMGQFKTTGFFRKNRTVMLVIVAAVALVGSIVGSSLYNLYFRPRVTKDLSPLEVVQTYYKSITDIDFNTVDDCVMSKAGRSDVNEVMNLFVITRQAEPIELTSSRLTADEWISRGKPPVSPGISMYGIAKLNITELAGEPEPAFRTEYEKWHNESVETDTGDLMKVVSIGYSRIDTLYLKMNRGAWTIFQLDRTKDQLIEDE